MTEKVDENHDWSATVQPIAYVNNLETFTSDKITFGALISEATGAFIITLMTMMISSKTQKFTEDKNLVALTKSAIVIAGRMMAGSVLVTGLPEGKRIAGRILQPDSMEYVII